MGHYVSTRELPPSIREARAKVDYHRPDIAIQTAERASIQDPGSDGRKGFALMVDIATGERRELWGSWGGANAFNPTNPVDLDRTDHELRPGQALILGSIGYRGTWASVTVHPSTIAPLLPSGDEVSELEAGILGVYRSYKSSARPEYLARMGAGPEMIDSLVSRGYLKRNRAGATQITTKGKNSAARVC
jgi:hypothetical protein